MTITDQEAVNDFLTHAQVIRLLRGRIKEPGDQRRLAQALGVSAPYLCFVLSGRKPPHKKVLDALGLTQVDPCRKPFIAPTERLYFRRRANG